ncbi:hypothetical protein JTE90_023334 [Oedothorax gibbosus]|uniref:Uncharacterized protein n=1 Tax=Oedothorax gibbosus TaxID=931172 RepID=A0AAV6VFA8_9ARAC|nr:hypothetical protein JTE90_023334 [Oedothorax gibbosus]
MLMQCHVKPIPEIEAISWLLIEQKSQEETKKSGSPDYRSNQVRKDNWQQCDEKDVLFAEDCKGAYLRWRPLSLMKSQPALANHLTPTFKSPILRISKETSNTCVFLFERGDKKFQSKQTTTGFFERLRRYDSSEEEGEMGYWNNSFAGL